jgi:hypothetical protein
LGSSSRARFHLALDVGGGDVAAAAFVGETLVVFLAAERGVRIKLGFPRLTTRAASGADQSKVAERIEHAAASAWLSATIGGNLLDAVICPRRSQREITGRTTR